MRGLARPNALGALGAWIWLLVAILPVYFIVVTSLRPSSDYYTENPLSWPSHPTLDAYAQVFQNDFVRYFANSVVVSAIAVGAILLVSLMASYVIARSLRAAARGLLRIFLLGIAIPIQATIVPVYFLIVQLGLYDTLAALILPSIAFGIPLSVLILTTFLRDVPGELFEAMRVDGASEWRMLRSLALPMMRPALVTVGVYNALSVWNGFLFPLVLTQSAQTRVLPLSLWSFQGEFSANIPAVLAAVVLSVLPLLAAYIVGRRQLVAGLTAGFGK